MQTNLLEYLEGAYKRQPERVVYTDERQSLAVAQMYMAARRLASTLCAHTKAKSPVYVLAEKSVLTPVLYHAILYAGCYYIPIGADLPKFRINTIMEIARAEVMLTDGTASELLEELNFSGVVIDAGKADEAAEIDERELESRRRSMLDIDPAYVLFTSGTSGKPKGIATSHRSVIDYIDAVAKAFSITGEDVFGSQAPFDYIAAIRDIYLPLHTGAKTVLIPKSLFSMPAKLLRYVNEKEITTLCWVAAALALCSELGALDSVSLETVKKVIFTGSALPCKHLRAWQGSLPDALYINHYGPTEITASCTYYIVQGKVADDDILPIGIPFENTGIILLNEDNTAAAPGEKGEICVRGAGLALGYYRDREKTAEAFIQNPLQDEYDEMIYKTGDIGSLLPDGNYAFHGRKDSQIKHMGHRIELSEIEAVVNTLAEVQSNNCLYKQDKEQIWLFYTASTECDNKKLSTYLRQRLPAHMIPRKFVKLEEFPRTFNGKVDVQALRAMMG